MANIEKAFEEACERYAEWGVDAKAAIKELEKVHISLHCWQGDDVGGFEQPDSELSGGGIQVTGNYPGKARNIGELRKDLEKAYSLIPGKHRLNLHAIYGEFGGKKVDRDAVEPKHFSGWVEWANNQEIALDFNATCFSHPLAESGFTLSDADPSVRAFWVEHVKRCREIAAGFGKATGSRAVHNLWIPDGCKDNPVGRLAARERLIESLDKIYNLKLDSKNLGDAVECKLFGIGSEAFVVGSHEFYMGYALSRKLMVCLDMGHFHPTEGIADKVSALLPFMPELLLHVSRGVRWDSDHVVTFNDDIRNLMQEIVRAKALSRVNIALDYFDASMNRVGAWVIGSRAALKALLEALLEPTALLIAEEGKGHAFERLAILEEAKALPLGAVWDYFCAQKGVPVGKKWLDSVGKYETDVQSKR
jgi:L-rhamnose isomerase